MREFKTLVIGAVVLAFVGGMGAGAWIGSLRAATLLRPSVDRRLQDWTERYDLSPSQERRVRAVLVRYDGGRDRIYSEISSEQWRRLNRLRDKSQQELDKILQEGTTSDSPDGG